VQLINERTRKPIADLVEVADTRKTRRRGLLGRDRLDDGAALMLVPCASIHTAFMRFPIDVVFIDGDGCIVRTASRVQPWRLRVALRARAVIELPAGRLDKGDVAVGDRLYLKPARVAEAGGAAGARLAEAAGGAAR
jgi:uncharacterized membrane protein (UPF0127 family)